MAVVGKIEIVVVSQTLQLGIMPSPFFKGTRNTIEASVAYCGGSVLTLTRAGQLIIRLK